MLQHGRWKAALVAAVVGTSGAAGAHELVCDKDVEGGPFFAVRGYPTALDYTFTVYNASTTGRSQVLSAEDPLLATRGFEFEPPPPFYIPLGGTASDSFATTLESYEECLELAASDGRVDRYIDNYFTVGWDKGEYTCAARVKCVPPREEPPPTDGGTPPTDGGTPPTDGGTPPTDGGTPPTDGGSPPPEGGATRTIGFYRNRPPYVEACLDEGPVDLGFITIPDSEEGVDTALGILRASPAFGPSGRRTELNQRRVQLGRQLFAAICNERLFGTDFSDALEAAARAALSGDVCDDIQALIDDVDDFNNSGTGESIGSPGPADPAGAAARADEPAVLSSGEDCSD
jgi:hypothetical protein